MSLINKTAESQNPTDQANQSKDLSSDGSSKRIKPKKVFLFVLALVLLASATVGGYIYLESQKQDGQEGGQKIDLFDRFPNSSNKGEMVVDGDLIWVANGEGLVRYDTKSGEQKVFTEADGLLGNETKSLVKYGDEVWVASAASGISILNTRDNSWRYFTTANGLVNDMNPVLRLDGDVVWFATFEGLGRYDFKTGNWTSWEDGDGIKFSGVDDLVFNNDFVWIYVSPDDTTKGGVLRLDKKSLVWEHFKLSKEKYFLAYEPLHLDGNFLHAVGDESDKKIYRQDVTSGQWKKFKKTKDNLTKFHIDTEKHDDKYWGFNEKGDIVVTGSGDEGEVIKTDRLNQYCPKVRHSWDDVGSTEDGYEEQFNFDDDVLWFGCHQGFALYDLSDKAWSFKETSPNYPAKIYRVLAVKNGTLLVDSNLGLGLVTPDKREWAFIKSLKGTKWSNAVWNGDNIYFFEYFLGIYGSYKPSRLWKYNITQKSLTRVKKPSDSSLGELTGGVGSTLWFVSGTGIGCDSIRGFNPASGKTASYKPKIDVKKGERFFIEDQNVEIKGDTIWFISDLGLGNFNTVSKKFEFIDDPSDVEFPGWEADYCWHGNLMGIAGDRIWIALGCDPDYAVYVYDPSAKTWEHVMQPDSAFGIDEVRHLVGASGYLLMSGTSYVEASQRTNGDIYFDVDEDGGTVYYERHGLNVYDIASNAWGYFTPEDGMLDGETGDVYVDGETVWFAHYGIYADVASGIWRLDLEKLKQTGL